MCKKSAFRNFNWREMMSAIEQAVNEWNYAKNQRDIWTAEERGRRKRLVDLTEFGANDSIREGSSTQTLGNGCRLTVQKKIRYAFNKNHKYVAERLQEVPEEVRRKVTKWTPSLVVSEYRELLPAHKEILDEVLTTTQSMTTVKIDDGEDGEQARAN